jgi:menaquinone-dependent protoporphyrinogen oxidase
MRVLVTYGSRHGGTGGLARSVADGLVASGHSVDVLPAAKVDALDHWDAVVIGGALYGWRWHRDARRFVRRHVEELQQRPVWCFSSGPLNHSTRHGAVPPTSAVQRLLTLVGARSHRTFGGRLLPGIKSPLQARGDYRDLDTARAGRALDWRGDRYTYVKRAGQPYGTLVWALSFADKEAAAYMFGKFAGKIMNRRLAGKLAKVDSTSDSLGRGSTYTFTSSSAATTLRRVDEQIWWLENTDTLTPQIIAALERQRTAPALAKKTQAAALPVTLAPSEKRKAIDGLLRHMLRY